MIGASKRKFGWGRGWLMICMAISIPVEFLSARPISTAPLGLCEATLHHSVRVIPWSCIIQFV